jgi:cbb3-type cytochrome oxidase subunit 1
MIDRLAIAAGVVGVSGALFALAFIANGIGQFHLTGTYVPPADLVDLLKLVFSASIVVLTWGGMKTNTKALEKREKDNGQKDQNQ